MDGGCRASSLGVLINKLSQSRRAPSNRLSLFHLHRFHLPSVPWARSQTLNILLPKINLYAPQLIAARRFCAILNRLFSVFAYMHCCARVSNRRPGILLRLTSSVQNCCLLPVSQSAPELLGFAHLTCKTWSKCSSNTYFKLILPICAVEDGSGWWTNDVLS